MKEINQIKSPAETAPTYKNSENECFGLWDDWDESPRIDMQRGHHVLRENESNVLVDFVSRKTEGALLLSGRRGTGKTSAVLTALRIASNKKRQDGRKILPVLINAPSMEISNRTDAKNQTLQEKVIDDAALLEMKKQIFQNLIRRLFKKIDNEKVDNEKVIDTYGISELYKKSSSNEVKQEIKDEQLHKKSITSEKEIVLNLSSTKKLIGIIVSLISAYIIYLNKIPGLGDAGNAVLSILTAIVPSVILTVSWGLKKTEVQNTEQAESASNYYAKDNSVSNLEADLEDVLEKLSINYKIIFVIDELDKLETDVARSVISTLKTLFNQSSALFIIITHDVFYRDIIYNNEVMVKEEDKRSKEYTLFAQKYFLTRPSFFDMEAFIDDIISESNKEQLIQNPKYKAFRNYLCYLAKTDFYDLYSVIRSYGTYHDGKPTLCIQLTKDKQITQSNLQKAMGQIYNLKFHESAANWYKNELLLARLYEILAKFEKYDYPHRFTMIRNPLQITFSDVTEDRDSIKIYDKVEAGAVMDFLNYLEKLKFLRVVSELGLVKTYEISGLLPKVEKKPHLLTEEQIEFRKEFRKTFQILLTYINIYNSYVSRFFNKYNLNDIKPNSARIDNFFQELDQIQIGIGNANDLREIIELSHIIEEPENIPEIDQRTRRENVQEKTTELRNMQERSLNHFYQVLIRLLSVFPDEMEVRMMSLDLLIVELKAESVSAGWQSELNIVMVNGKEGQISDGALLFVQDPAPDLKRALQRIGDEFQNLFLFIVYVNRFETEDFMDKFEKATSQEERDRLDKLLRYLSTQKESDLTSRVFELEIPKDGDLLVRLIRGLDRVIRDEKNTTSVSPHATPAHVTAPYNRNISKHYNEIISQLSPEPNEVNFKNFITGLTQWYTSEQAWKYMTPETNEVYERLHARIIETAGEINTPSFGLRYADLFRLASQLRDYLQRK